MKLADLIRYLSRHGCIFVREGGNHTICKNPQTGKMTSVPRHRGIKENLARKICADLDIPKL